MFCVSRRVVGRRLLLCSLPGPLQLRNLRDERIWKRFANTACESLVSLEMCSFLTDWLELAISVITSTPSSHPHVQCSGSGLSFVEHVRYSNYGLSHPNHRRDTIRVIVIAFLTSGACVAGYKGNCWLGTWVVRWKTFSVAM